MITIIRSDINNNDFRELVKLLDEELNSTYGSLQAQYDQYNNLETLDAVVIGYRDHTPAGCGGFRILDADTVEIKRMMVKPEDRGTGIAMQILHELEKWAMERGFSKAVLETGIKQHAAIRFYTKLGYSQIENYGSYVGNSNSICMCKEFKGS